MAATEMTNVTVETKKEPLNEAALTVRILLSVLLFVVAWAGSIVTWGLPGLFIPAVALVPVLIVGLVIITRG